MTAGRHAHVMRIGIGQPSAGNTLLRRTVLIISAGALVAGCAAAPGTTSGTPNAPATTAGVATTGSVPASTASTASTGGKLDPCSMLTASQVATALGEAPASGKPEPDFDAPECEWDPASGHNGNVTLDVGPWVGNPGVKPLRLGSPVSDIGDEAFDGGNTGLYVHKGSQGFRIWVFNVHTQSSRLDLEKQLAGILLGEM